MWLERLTIREFRNIRACDLTFTTGVNRIVGANGQGKSNLLEAIGLLASGRSFRKAGMAHMRRWGESRFRLEGVIRQQNLRRTLEITGEATGQQVRLDGKAVRSVIRMEQVLVAVICTPDTPQLVRGSPAERRAFLDWVIFRADPRHAEESKAWQQATRARIALLKQGWRTPNELIAWEMQISHLGARIGLRRHRVLIHLQRLLPTALEALGLDPAQCGIALEGDLEPFFQNGESSDAVACRLQEQLIRCREKDRITGTTGCGPHRDELTLLWQKHPVARFGSRGQQHRFALGLKLAEADWLHERFGQAPLLILDDPVAELDQEGVMTWMTRIAEHKGQVFVTTRENEQQLPWPRHNGLTCLAQAGSFQISMEQNDR